MVLLPVEPVRDVDQIVLRRWGRVRAGDGVVPWELLDDAGHEVEPVQRYVRDLVAQGKSSGTIRSYAFVLQRWWRFLIAVDVTWEGATLAECRDFVLWLLRSQSRARDRARRRLVQRAQSIRSPASGTRVISTSPPRSGTATLSCIASTVSAARWARVRW